MDYSISNKDIELMFENGLSFTDISKISKIELIELKKVLSKYIKNITTSNFKIEIMPMKEKEFLELKSDRVIGIKEDYFSYCSLVKEFTEGLNLAQVYLGFKNMSGGTGITRIGHKSSFLFVFRINYYDYKNDKKYLYYLKASDCKGGLEFNFGRNIDDSDMDKFKELGSNCEINPINDELTRDMLNIIICTVLSHMHDETKKFSDIKIEEFEKTIEVPEIVYGLVSFLNKGNQSLICKG